MQLDIVSTFDTCVLSVNPFVHRLVNDKLLPERIRYEVFLIELANLDVELFRLFLWISVMDSDHHVFTPAAINAISKACIK